MPQIIPANVDTKGGTARFVDARGRASTARYAGLASATTEAQVLAIINAAGTLSNAAIVEQEYKSKSEASITASTALDEAESSVRSGANLIFQNTVTLATRSFRVPAPNLQYIDASGRFLVPPANDADVQAMVDAVLAALGGSWVYVNAPISVRDEGTAQQVERPLVAEPTP